MRPKPWVVERTLICMNCGVPVEIEGDGVMVWVHADDGYRTCAWVRVRVDGSSESTCAEPTDWADAGMGVGFAPIYHATRTGRLRS